MKAIELQALRDACWKDDIVAVNRLLALPDFDINYKNGNGTRPASPLHISLQKNNKEIMMLLIENGADLEIKDEYWNSVLKSAAECCNCEMVELLINNGANIDSQDNDNWTALMMAAANEDHEVIRLLMRFGADRYIVSSDNQLAVDLAFEQKDIISMILIDDGLINDEYDGESLIIRSCKNNNEEDVLFLHSKGADFNRKNADGESALGILESHEALSENLQALRDKLILEADIDQETNSVLSL